MNRISFFASTAYPVCMLPKTISRSQAKLLPKSLCSLSRTSCSHVSASSQHSFLPRLGSRCKHDYPQASQEAAKKTSRLSRPYLTLGCMALLAFICYYDSDKLKKNFPKTGRNVLITSPNIN